MNKKDRKAALLYQLRYDLRYADRNIRDAGQSVFIAETQVLSAERQLHGARAQSAIFRKQIKDLVGEPNGK